MVDQLIPGKFKRLRHFKGSVWTTSEIVAAKSITAIRKNKGLLVVVTPLARVMWWLSRLAEVCCVACPFSAAGCRLTTLNVIYLSLRCKF